MTICRYLALLVLAALFCLSKNSFAAEDFPSWRDVSAVAERHFRSLDRFDSRDLLSRGQVQPLFPLLANLGWDVADQQAILEQVPSDSEFLVQQLRSPAGVLFMRKVAGYEMIYDRLDRIAREPGGEELLRDLIKLPDAQRYVKKKVERGLPDLIDFLPKGRSGKRRQVKDYDHPTERIYTLEALLDRLKQSHDQAKQLASKQDGKSE